MMPKMRYEKSVAVKAAFDDDADKSIVKELKGKIALDPLAWGDAMPVSAEVTEVDEDGLMAALAWQDHNRGRNWMAVISGPLVKTMDREFLGRAGGRFYNVTDLKVGDAFEVGADYYNSRQQKRPFRRYGIVLARGDGWIAFEQLWTPGQALKAAAHRQQALEKNAATLRKRSERQAERDFMDDDAVEALAQFI